jgi:hypothetical protein
MIGRTVMPGDFMSTSRKLMPSWRLATSEVVRARMNRGPGLGAVDDVMVSCKVRSRLERREVGTRPGLRVALAPPYVGLEDIGQEALLLLLVAEGVDDRSDHVEPEGDDWRCIRFRHLDRENVLLDRGPARAAVLDGPVDAGPAVLVEPLLESDEVVAFEGHRAVAFAAEILGIVVAENCANMLAEREFLLTESDVHGAPLRRNCPIREVDCHRMRSKVRPDRAE